jgi:maleylpyruvate isomerase
MATSTAIPHLQEMVVATTRYLGALTELTDEDMRAPSLLPGWSRGHVVTHLARNADALGNLLHWAESGVENPMYASREQRDADIEAGADRSAHDLRVDSSAAAGRFLQAINELDVEHEDALVSKPGGRPFPARQVALERRIEIEVHHADLGLGFGCADWDADFAALLLERVGEDRADGPAVVLRATDTDGVWKYGVPGQGPEVRGPVVDLAWWALGRGNGEGLTTDADVLPDLGAWR